MNLPELRYDRAGASGTRPERLLLVPRRVEDGRYLFARWPDWPHPAMLSTVPPRPHERLEGAVESLLYGRMGLRLAGEWHASQRRVPVRMVPPGRSDMGLGWLRPLAVAVAGEPDADGLLESVESLTLEEALAALPTDVEREALRLGAALFDAPGA